MLNKDVLVKVENGYRMPKPAKIDCPDSFYDMMLKCWDSEAEKRPTFDYLHHFFEDYFIETERQYHDANEDIVLPPLEDAEDDREEEEGSEGSEAESEAEGVE